VELAAVGGGYIAWDDGGKGDWTACQNADEDGEGLLPAYSDEFTEFFRIKIMSQYVNSYMFRASLVHYQGAYRCTRKSFNPVSISSVYKNW
jgi:hypothetical protein